MSYVTNPSGGARSPSHLTRHGDRPPAFPCGPPPCCPPPRGPPPGGAAQHHAAPAPAPVPVPVPGVLLLLPCAAGCGPRCSGHTPQEGLPAAPARQAGSRAAALVQAAADQHGEERQPPCPRQHSRTEAGSHSQGRGQSTPAIPHTLRHAYELLPGPSLLSLGLCSQHESRQNVSEDKKREAAPWILTSRVFLRVLWSPACCESCCAGSGFPLVVTMDIQLRLSLPLLPLGQIWPAA